VAEVDQQNNNQQEPKKRGGKRPGAGAPKGNLNAMKHGRYSKQFATIGALLAHDPTVRDALLKIADRASIKNERANEIGALWVSSILTRAKEISRGEHPLGLQGLNITLPADISETITEGANRATARQLRTAAKTLRKAAKNFPPDQGQSPPDAQA
jgi:hypothetical protein